MKREYNGSNRKDETYKNVKKDRNHSNLIGTAIEDRDKPSTTSSSSTTNKHLPIWKQEVTDERGRKRFHGAFTGGYSAGYFNTVGSKEGWTPSAFKSTKNDRSSTKQYSAQDFMDDEDLNDISARDITTKPDFDMFQGTSSIFNQNQDNNSLIDGIFKDIIEPNKDPIGMRLLKKMGWKDGQTRVVKKTYQRKQPRITIVDNDDNYMSSYTQQEKEMVEDEMEDDGEEELVSVEYGKHFAKPVEFTPKNDLFGIGYEPSDDVKMMRQHQSSTSTSTPHPLLPSSYKPQQPKPKQNSRLTFGGMDDDDGVYDTNLFDKYDKSIGKSTTTTTSSSTSSSSKNSKNRNEVLDFLMPSDHSNNSNRSKKCSDGSQPLKGFVVAANQSTLSTKWFQPPVLPPNFDYRHRYASPLDASIINRPPQIVTITPDQRSIMLDERMLPGMKQQHQQQPQQSLVAATKTSSSSSDTKSFESIQKAFSNRFVSADESMAHTAKEVEKQRTKPVRTVRDWYPEPLICKRFNIDDPYKHLDRNQIKEAIQQQHQQQFNWRLKLDPEQQQQQNIINDLSFTQQPPLKTTSSTTQSNNQKDNTINDPNIEYSFLQVSRPPMDLFKAIFESGENEDNTTTQDESYDPFSFQSSSTSTNNIQTTTTTTPLHINNTTTTTTATPTNKSNFEEIEEEEYDPFSSFKSVQSNQPIQPIIPSFKANNNNNNVNTKEKEIVKIEVQEDEDDYDPFASFVKSNSQPNNQSKPIQPIINSSLKKSNSSNQQPIQSIDIDEIPTVSLPPLTDIDMNQTPTVPLPPQQPTPSYYKVIDIKPYNYSTQSTSQPSSSSSKYVEKKEYKGGYSEKEDRKREVERERDIKKKKNEVLENIKSYLSNFSDSDNSNSSTSDSSDDERRKRKEKRRKEKKKKLKEKKKEKKRDKDR